MRQVFKSKISKTLDDGSIVFVFPPEYYLAAKFDAHRGRGGNELRQSRDFEDIIYIMENCSALLDNINSANSRVKTYLIEECHNLLGNKNLAEGVESALPYGSGEEGTDIILELINNVAIIEKDN